MGSIRLTEPEITADEKQQVLEARAQKAKLAQFQAEFDALLKQYGVGLGAVAHLTPDGRVVAEPTIGFVANAS